MRIDTGFLHRCIGSLERIALEIGNLENREDDFYEILRAAAVKEFELISIKQLATFSDALHDSMIPYIVEARDWSRLPESFHREIEQNFVSLTTQTT